jgi:hypothetical protein
VRQWAISPIACPSSRNLAAAIPTTHHDSPARATGIAEARSRESISESAVGCGDDLGAAWVRKVLARIGSAPIATPSGFATKRTTRRKEAPMELVLLGLLLIVIALRETR